MPSGDWYVTINRDHTLIPKDGNDNPGSHKEVHALVRTINKIYNRSGQVGQKRCLPLAYEHLAW